MQAAECGNTGEILQGKSNKRKLVFVERAAVESLNDADPSVGIVHVDGTRHEIFGVLPGEEVSFTHPHRKQNGTLVEIFKASEHRAKPRCSLFGKCGGCSLMHMTHEMQLEVKQKLLLTLLKCENVDPIEVLPPLSAGQYNYRGSARPNVRFLPEREDRPGGNTHVGFMHKWLRGSNHVSRCEVMREPLPTFFDDVASVIHQLSVRKKVPTVEVMLGDTEKCLLLRHLDPLTQADKSLLTDFARTHKFHLYTQPKGPDSISLLASPYEEVPSPLSPTAQGQNSSAASSPVDPFARFAKYLRPALADTPIGKPPFSPLFYTIPKHNIKIHFNPSDFIQVNNDVNQMLVDQALEFLAPKKKDKILDLFCGLGNFTLPIARYTRSVIGVEWLPSTVAKAQANAELNGLGNVQFYADDLYSPALKQDWLHSSKKVNKIIIDPPRSGAMVVLKRLMEHNVRPERIVYVSCNPKTLAPDLAYLETQNYRVTRVRTADMFPNTNHTEAIALVERNSVSVTPGN